jgi:hypothetical protein
MSTTIAPGVEITARVTRRDELTDEAWGRSLTSPRI